MGVIADWTTAGPYAHISWLTITFTAGVILTLVLTVMEQRDAWRTFKAVQHDHEQDQEGMAVLVTSTLIRSISRILIQLAFLALACSSIYLGVTEDTSFRYWYRIIFVTSFLGAEAILCLSVINDIVARHKLEAYISSRKESN